MLHNIYKKINIDKVDNIINTVIVNRVYFFYTYLRTHLG